MNKPSALFPLVPERRGDGPAVSALIERAFGPGRYAKAAERLREANRPLLDLSFVPWADGRPIGCARVWPIAIGAIPALLLGPFAVDAASRNQGLGVALVRRACEDAQAAGHGLILLIGDETYFARAGFSAAPARRVVMPGPVDPRRILARELRRGAADDLAGSAMSWPAFTNQLGLVTP